jgi:hypothetical protein
LPLRHISSQSRREENEEEHSPIHDREHESQPDQSNHPRLVRSWHGDANGVVQTAEQGQDQLGRDDSACYTRAHYEYEDIKYDLLINNQTLDQPADLE